MLSKRLMVSGQSRLRNFIGGQWIESSGKRGLTVRNPATSAVLCEVPVSGDADVDRAVGVATEAFRTWRAVPASARARTLYRFKELLEARFEDIARAMTCEHGKTLDEARGALRRGLGNVAAAAAAPMHMRGHCHSDVSAGLDVETHLEPVGVFAAITSSRFPVLAPLWFLPYAVATGNTFVLKPSPRVPMSIALVFELATEAGFPAGVVNLVHGDDSTGRQLLEHPDVLGLSFVGNKATAHGVYERAAAFGKRVQAFGGARQHLVVMPDANLERTVAALTEAAFGCAGQRWQGTTVIAVGDIYEPLLERLNAAARALVVGDGLDAGVDMGPVVAGDKLDRIASSIGAAIGAGGRALVDGRELDPNDIRADVNGQFIGPSVLVDLPVGCSLEREEFSGPVMVVRRAHDLDKAIGQIDASPCATVSSIFTSAGAAAREFRVRASSSMVGINSPVTVPVAAFPFSGARGSFFGDLKAQGRDAIRFFSEQKVVISRWF